MVMDYVSQTAGVSEYGPTFVMVLRHVVTEHEVPVSTMHRRLTDLVREKRLRTGKCGYVLPAVDVTD